MKGRHRIGIREIAELANVSKAAVSYALNETGRLDPTTRRRVIEIAQASGYVANPHARSLRSKRPGAIAISASLASEMSEVISGSDFFVQIWQGAASQALRRGLTLTLVPFGTGLETLPHLEIEGGIVIDPVAADPIAADLGSRGVPHVLIGRDAGRPDGGGWVVDSPHRDLATEVFSHFAARGARRIGLILSSDTYAYNRAIRDAYCAWMGAKGADNLLVAVAGQATEAAGYAAAMSLLQARHPPDAIYATLDRLATGALFAAERCGVGVPGGLMLAAGTDGPVTRNAVVPITAVDVSPAALGRAAVTMLIDRIERDIGPSQLLVPGRLQVRASTDPF